MGEFFKFVIKKIRVRGSHQTTAARSQPMRYKATGILPSHSIHQMLDEHEARAALPLVLPI